MNSFETFAVRKAKQFVACNDVGYVIGDAILFYLDDELLSLVGCPSAVGPGDVITLELSADTWAGIQWSATDGAGGSSVSILRR